MKAGLLVIWAFSFLLVACQPVTRACASSCDEVITQLTRLGPALDDLGHAAANGRSVAQRLPQAQEELTALQRIVAREVVVGRDAYQTTINILGENAQSADELTRLSSWAKNTYEGTEFYGNLVCAYRDAFFETWGEPTYADLAYAFMDRYSAEPFDEEDAQEKWAIFENGLNRKGFNIWDASVTLYCVVSDLNPDSD